MKLSTQQHLDDLVKRYPALGSCGSDILAAFELLHECYDKGGKVMVCGNGGSAADAEHITGELMKGYLLHRRIPERDAQALLSKAGKQAVSLIDSLQRAIPAISLVSQTSLATAVCNDTGSDMVFAQQVYGYGKKGDVLWALSTSGNAANICQALRVARAMGLGTVGLTGESGGAMKELCGVAICVPAHQTFKIQEYHLPVYHALCAMLESEAFGE